MLCAVNIRSCKSSSAIFNSLWRDDAFHLSVTGWWVFTNEKPPSAYFSRASHCWCCSSCGVRARAFVWCLRSVGGSQFTYAVWQQLDGDLPMEDITCVFGSMEFACNCLKLCTLWFGAAVNVIFLLISISSCLVSLCCPWRHLLVILLQSERTTNSEISTFCHDTSETEGVTHLCEYFPEHI